jgi:tRNA(fMet)-specific endonuclease VapC
MKNLLDTCVLAEYQKPAPDVKVMNWLAAQIEESLFLSVLTVGEIEKGIARLPSSKRKNNLETFLENLVTRFDRRILNLDTLVLRRWGHLTGGLEKKGRVLTIVDSLLAATALEYNLTIVTRNTADFADTGTTVLNVWE